METNYQWPSGFRSAVVFSVDVDAESVYLWRNRANLGNRLGEVEQRRFGPRQGLGRLLELLREFAIKGSFYVPGWVAETYPNILPAIEAAQHELGCHGHYHERVDELTKQQNETLLGRQLDVFRRQIGRAPLGYRSASWDLTPEVHSMLRQRGFIYDSSLMGFDHPYSIDGLVEVPPQWLIDDSTYFRYVGLPTDNAPVDPAAVLSGWVEAFEASREFGGLFMITVHDWVSGYGPRIRMLRSLLTHILKATDVWVATSEDIARHHLQSTNANEFAVKLCPLEASMEF